MLRHYYRLVYWRRRLTRGIRRPARLAAAAAAFIALSGYVATEFIKQSAPSVTPPSPYASQEPVDCLTGKLDPVHCPISDGECHTPAPSSAEPRRPPSFVPDADLLSKGHAVLCAVVRAVPAN
ncbi:hypothetical protein ACIHCQ_28370 [Streptomyces sp. NPDC052236]|uniref:hypothetical protein n=1 Tax=Streptomyces sp. NPDC052236 TaxID=3365686 RepID=UPI0037D5D72C